MSDFETWWQQEGQEFLYALNTTTDDDIKLVAEIAWKNGAYGAEQAEQEPVAWHEPGAYSNVTVYKNWANENGWIPLYAAPVRTKDLTDDEIDKIATDFDEEDPDEGYWRDFARAVIAADREKNRG